MSGVWPVGLMVAAPVALVYGCALIALYSGLGRLLFREDSRYKALITDDGPELGSPLPTVAGRDARTGAPIATTRFLQHSLVLLFVSPGCDVCDELLEAVRARRRGWREDVSYLIVVQAPVAEAARYLARLPGIALLADPEEAISHACGVERTPVGMLVDPAGYVRMKGIVNTRDQLAGLIAGQGRPVAGLSWTPDV